MKNILQAILLKLLELPQRFNWSFKAPVQEAVVGSKELHPTLLTTWLSKFYLKVGLQTHKPGNDLCVPILLNPVDFNKSTRKGWNFVVSSGFSMKVLTLG